MYSINRQMLQKRHYLRRIYTFARNNAAPRDNRSRLGAQQLWRHREW